MNLQDVLVKHAAGFYDQAFDGLWDSGSVMTGYIVHDNDPADGINTRSKISGACHASVNTYIHRPTAVAVITMADRKLVDNPGAVAYYDWLINRSFFADVFACKDPILSLNHGFVKQIDVSAAKWLGAAQLCRLSTSEFKNQMKAVYDVIASGFDIHPALLTVLATELNWVSDRKTIKATRSARINNIHTSFYSGNSSHLPFVYLETEEVLKDLCKDDPNKPIEDIYRETFRNVRWQNASNYVASRFMKNYTGSNSQRIRDAMLGLTQGTPSMLFNLQEAVQEVPYLFLWEDAVKELKSKVARETNTNVNGVGMNLTAIELLSKTLKLGE